MALESVAFALAFWGLSRCLGPLLEAVGADVNGPGPVDEGIAQVAAFVGPGIYEEVLFRLVLIRPWSSGCGLFVLPGPATAVLAALVSATLFSAAPTSALWRGV